MVLNEFSAEYMQHHQSIFNRNISAVIEFCFCAVIISLRVLNGEVIIRILESRVPTHTESQVDVCKTSLVYISYLNSLVKLPQTFYALTSNRRSGQASFLSFSWLCLCILFWWLIMIDKCILIHIQFLPPICARVLCVKLTYKLQKSLYELTKWRILVIQLFP